MLIIAELEAIVVTGGAPRVALLRHCVKSITMEPLFLFVAREYRFRPTHVAAIALYDLFCAQDAPARVRAPDALPPRDLRLPATIASLRRQLAAPPVMDDEPAEVRLTVPSFELFDNLTATIRADASGALATLAERYDPQRTPQENLPGGELTGPQRYFVDNVWRPRVRPALAAAGFWQLSSID